MNPQIERIERRLAEVRMACANRVVEPRDVFWLLELVEYYRGELKIADTEADHLRLEHDPK